MNTATKKIVKYAISAIILLNVRRVLKEWRKK